MSAGEREVGVDVGARQRGTRTAGPAPWPMTRSEHVRLSRPHATAVGANEPAAKRL